MLRGAPALQELCFYSHHHAGGEGALRLPSGLEPQNCKLQKFNLSLNSAGDDGASALAASLHGSNTIAEQGLSENDIGDHGASTLAELVTSSKSVVCMDILLTTTLAQKVPQPWQRPCPLREQVVESSRLQLEPGPRRWRC